MSESRKYYQDYEELCENLHKSGADYDYEKIEKAYRLADEAHKDQRRISGVPYILHPTSVACILADLGMDTDSIVAALLHDVVEDTEVTLEELAEQFSKDVSHLVNGVTKIGKIAYTTREERQAENVRKMLIAMADDIRVIIIKLADRLHNMRTIDCMREQKRRDIALETMEVFAPIAHRLGIKAIKDEMEDLSLQYLDPIGYKEIETRLQELRSDGQGFIDHIMD
ncbi:MAG: HD domain-containing protein, partial [Lachnospiraceae bacterium]|nr:HD domain-containing protein [Lachnospiraceae bacterium]